jgi:hypothetical protein
MKKKLLTILIITVLLLSVSFLAYVNESLSEADTPRKYCANPSAAAQSDFSEIPEYNLSVEYNWGEQKLNVQATLNVASNGLKDSVLYFLLPANGLKSKRTLFAFDKNLESTDFTSFKFSDVKINGENAKYRYIAKTGGFTNDSTLIGMRLPVSENNYYKIEFKYSLIVPEGNYIFGYSKHKNFSLLNGFYPMLLQKNNPADNFYSFNACDLQASNFNIKVKVAENISILNPEFVKESLAGSYIGVFKKIKNPAIIFKDVIKKYNHKQFDVGGQNAAIWLQEKNSDFVRRIKDALQNSNNYLTKFMKVNNCNSLLFVELPRSFKIEKFSASGVTGFHINLFSPIWKKEPEATIINSYVAQFFDGSFTTEFREHPWMRLGISEFITDEIFHRFYGNLSQSFNLVSYLPVKGENMFSYDEIPIIYTLSSFNYEPWKDKIDSYLKFQNKIAFGNLPNNYFGKDFCNFVEVIKPSLGLEIFKNYYGIENLKKVFREFQNLCQNSGTISALEFNSAILNVLGKDAAELWENLTLSSGKIDLRIDNISHISDTKYSLVASLSGNLSAPVDIEVYTDKDTLRFSWNTKENIKQIFFDSSADVFGAAVDPKYKILFDENFADNSFFFDSNLTTSFSFAIHWFFWVQNALMIFGVFG